MFLYLKIWFFRKFFGRTALDVIEKLMDAKLEEMIALTAMHQAASQEHDLAEATLNNPKNVLG